MSIAEKLTTVADNQQRVYDAGKKAECDAFWDVFQQNGEPSNYYYAFAYGKFTDENYNPKHPIICKSGSTAAGSMFYNSTITNTKVPITIPGASTQTFGNCSALKTIPLLTLTENTTYNNTFAYCSALEDITIDGVIGQNGLDFSACKNLSHDSLQSILRSLENKTSGTFTLKLGAANIEKLPPSAIVSTSRKGWTLAE